MVACLIFCVFILVVSHLSSATYTVVLSGDASVVRGGTIRIKAELFDYNGNPASGKFRYQWSDNANPTHTALDESEKPYSYWNITYGREGDYPGLYLIQVNIDKNYVIFVWEPIARQSMYVNVTSLLNGQLEVIQGGTIKGSDFVSNNGTVHHHVRIQDSDMEYIQQNASTVYTFWFVDCVYYGYSTTFNLDFNFTKVNENHYIEAIVLASFAPPTTPAPPTTTSTPTNSTTPNPNITTATTPKTTTIKPNLTLTSNFTEDFDLLFKSTFIDLPFNEDAKPLIGIYQNGTFKSVDTINSLKKLRGVNNSFCINATIIPQDLRNAYGYFSRRVSVRAPIQNVTIQGTNWLQHRDILNMDVKCSGSPPYYYCLSLQAGLVNTTGNETCTKDFFISNCSIPIQHFFKEAATYTYIVIISNQVSKLVTPIAINVYDVTTHAQLSVVVVPVVFSLIAVILIIFGVAFYVQSRRSITIEVADFDFSSQVNDMEYKTFRERLRDSLSNSFQKSPDFSEQDGGESVWGKGRRYGSMQ